MGAFDAADDRLDGLRRLPLWNCGFATRSALRPPGSTRTAGRVSLLDPEGHRRVPLGAGAGRVCLTSCLTWRSAGAVHQRCESGRPRPCPARYRRVGARSICGPSRLRPWTIRRRLPRGQLVSRRRAIAVGDSVALSPPVADAGSHEDVLSPLALQASSVQAGAVVPR